MNKKNKNIKEKKQQVEKIEHNKEDDTNAYDFIPNLHEWVNIDEQKNKAKELEDI